VEMSGAALQEYEVQNLRRAACAVCSTCAEADDLRNVVYSSEYALNRNWLDGEKVWFLEVLDRATRARIPETPAEKVQGMMDPEHVLHVLREIWRVIFPPTEIRSKMKLIGPAKVPTYYRNFEAIRRLPIDIIPAQKKITEGMLELAKFFKITFTDVETITTGIIPDTTRSFFWDQMYPLHRIVQDCLSRPDCDFAMMALANQGLIKGFTWGTQEDVWLLDQVKLSLGADPGTFAKTFDATKYFVAFNNLFKLLTLRFGFGLNCVFNGTCDIRDIAPAKPGIAYEYVRDTADYDYAESFAILFAD